MEPAGLRRGECLSLLAGSAVGRVVYTEDALPAARPVTFLLDGDEVLFRAGAGSSLAGTAHQVVGFEADGFDLADRTGWSVLGVGIAYEVTDAGRLTGLAGRVPGGWDDGWTTATIAVPLQRLTGRRLAPAARQR